MILLEVRHGGASHLVARQLARKLIRHVATKLQAQVDAALTRRAKAVPAPLML